MKYFSFYIILFISSCLHAQQKKVLATASMWADMADVIGGGMVDVDMIVPVGSDPHLYEPTPSDIRKVHEADIILINGLHFEGWLQKLIESANAKAPQILLTKDIIPIQSETYDNAKDPHAWMDVRNVKKYCEAIKLALIALVPMHKEEFTFNHDIYQKELDALDAYVKNSISKIPESQRVLITSHDAFHYYAKAYGVQVESLLGTSTDADIQTEDIVRVSNIIREKQIPAIFVESTINPKIMYELTKDTKVVIGGKLYADSLGDSTTTASTYTDMIKHNTDIITSALSKSKVVSSEIPVGKQRTHLILGLLGALIAITLFLVYTFNRS